MKEYKQELFAQKTPYLQWLKVHETELEKHRSTFGEQIYTLPFSSCMDSLQGDREFLADAIYLFVKKDGMLSDYAAGVFAEVFAADTAVRLAYADEDYQGSLKELYHVEDKIFGEEITSPYHFGAGVYYRGEPWFKPDFSPDTLASFFYVGSIFAVRGSMLLEMTRKYGSDISIYELVYRIFMEMLDQKVPKRPEGIVHIAKVLYTNDSLADKERIDSAERIKALYRAREQSQDASKISIIIPSKDNAKVLRTCLQTLTQYTNDNCYEIIIVDNGSDAKQKAQIMEMAKNYAATYLYEKMDFNFSRMCNIGARAASGDYLLFLNDDIEVMDTDAGRKWLDQMMLYAKKSHVGAVGAKLYYPLGPNDAGSYRIQHVGITNMGIGPAHKLGGVLDAGCLYHGHNTQNYDMLAVTAACMLIRKSVFDEADGFDEAFPVAYNDVEFCLRLYQKGYFNVQVNDAILLHHESLSRGQDTLPEKQRRLGKDKERLYKKHPLFISRDPFYNPNLVQWKKDVEYTAGYLYAFDRQIQPTLLDNSTEGDKKKKAIFKKYDCRVFLQATGGLAAKIYDRLTGYHNVLFNIDSVCYDDGIEEDNLTIEGWCAVKNTDNANIPRKLWLIYETRTFDFRSVYVFDIAPKLREDVAALLEGADTNSTKNTALSGIQVNIKKSVLRPGTYRIGVLCNNRLVCDPERYIEISDRNTLWSTSTTKGRCEAI